MEGESARRAEEALAADLRWLGSLARRIVSDPGLADDAAQEAWMAATRRASREGAADRPDRLTLRAALWGIVLHARRGAARRTARERRAARPEALPSTAEMLERAEQQQRLWSRVTALAEPYRRTVLLRYQQGLSTSRIAEREGVGEDTVRWRLRRAHRDLGEALGRDRRGGGLAALVPLAAGSRTDAGTIGWMTATGIGAMKTLITAAALITAALAGLWLFQLDGDPGEARRTDAATAARGIPAIPEPTSPAELPAAPSRSGPRSSPGAAAPAGTLEEAAILVRGQLLDVEGDPAAAVRITLRADGLWTRAARSGADGAFEVSCPGPRQGPGTVHLTADAGPRFVRAHLPIGNAPYCGAPPLAAPVTDLGTITLRPAGVVTGRCVDSQGLPLEGLDVQELRVGGPTATTGPDGRFDLGGCRPGELSLAATGRGMLKAVAQVTVIPGATADAGELIMVPGPVVTGRLLGRDGRPVKGARAFVGSSEGAVAEDGTFRVRGWNATSIVVEAQAPGHRPAVSAWCEPGAHVEMTLHPLGPPCRIRVVDGASGEDVPGAQVSLQERTQKDRPALGEGLPRQTERSADGAAFLAGGLPGVDKIEVRAPGYMTAVVPLAPAASGGGTQVVAIRRRPTSIIVAALPAGVAPASATVRFERIEASREGATGPGGQPAWESFLPVPDGSPGEADLTEAWLRERPVRRTAERFLVRPAADGSLTLRYPVRGLVRAVAESGGELFVTEPRPAAPGRRLDLGTLQSVRPGAIDGHLALDPSYRVDGATLALAGNPGHPLPVDRHGRFAARQLLPGSYWLQAREIPDGVDRSKVERVVVVAPGRSTAVTIPVDLPPLVEVPVVLRINGAAPEGRPTIVFTGDDGARYGWRAPARGRLPVDRDLRADVMLDGIDAPGFELPFSVRATAGEPLVIDVELGALVCELGPEAAAAGEWRRLHWRDASGQERCEIEPARMTFGRTIPSADTGTVTIHFPGVPVGARDLRLAFEGPDGQTIEWPIPGSIRAGGTLRFQR